jgi:hypothetical protein
MSQAIVTGSLRDIEHASGRAISESFLSVAAIICLDISASMSERDCGQYGESRYAVAIKQLERLQHKLSGKIGIVQWNHEAKFQAGGLPDQPYGSTNVRGCLEYIKPADGTGIKLILISDGEPNVGEDGLDIARTFTSKIDTVYVGPEGGDGARYLRELSRLTGGVSASQNVSEICNLAQTVTRLLAA